MTMLNFCINFLIKQRNCYQFYMISLSHPSRMRGLKCLISQYYNILISRIPRGAWIKICRLIRSARTSHPSWVRGLKYVITLSFLGDIHVL